MVYFCYSSSLNVCRLHLLVWIAIWPLCGKVTVVWLSTSIRVQLFRVCVSFPLMSLMGDVG